MHPTLRRFRDSASELPADPEEDARELAHSLQPAPLPPTRALTAAALRDLQARVGSQYVPSTAQLQLFQQQQQQTQRRAASSHNAFFPRGGDAWDDAEYASVHNLFEDSAAEFEQVSLNAQFLPPSMSKYRRAAPGALEHQAERERERRAHQQQHQQQQLYLQQQAQLQQQLQQQQQQQQQLQQQQQQQQQVMDDPEGERDRMFRMRAMFLQQQHELERQKQEERQRTPVPQPPQQSVQSVQQQRRQATQRHQTPPPSHHQQHQQQHQTQQSHQQQTQHQTQQHQSLDAPRRIHRELQPAPPVASLASAPHPAAASFAVRAPAQPPVPASGLNLPLPPPLSSTARRFGGTGGALNESAMASEQISSLEASVEPAQTFSNKQAPRKGPAPPLQRAEGATNPRTIFRDAVDAQQAAKRLTRELPNVAPGAGSGRHRVGVEESESEEVLVNEDSDGPKSGADESGADESGADESGAARSSASAARRHGGGKRKASRKAKSSAAPAGEPKRRCGRKSMNYSSEEKRERNRAAVKKCRQRQALKYDYLLQKAEVLATENTALADMLANNVELEDERRASLTRGIQMDILFKIKEIFTQSLPKDFVLDADSIWDLNSVLAVSMPSRCYYGIESIKEFWRTSLRMRNKGKIRSFWAWLFRLPPGDRFAEFDIVPFAESSNLYFVTWTTKSEPPLSGSMVIMFGQGHRVTLHVECFGWLIWRYLLSNEPFPEPSE